jgi:hypothetical protein
MQFAEDSQPSYLQLRAGCPASQIKSLQGIATLSLHRTIGLKTVLPLLGWCRAYPTLLADTHEQCRR